MRKLFALLLTIASASLSMPAWAACVGSAGVPMNCDAGSTVQATDLLFGGHVITQSPLTGQSVRWTLPQALAGIGLFPVPGAATLQAQQNLGLVIGTNVEAWAPNLDALAALSGSANSFPYFTGTNSMGVATFGTGLSFTGGVVTTTGAPPTGSAGGDLGGTYPNPTVLHLTHVTDGSLANSGLANSSITINGSPVSLGGTITVSAAPSGSAGGDLGGTYPNPTVTNLSHVTNASLPNSGLVNPSLTVAGHLIALGGTQAIACADLSNGATGCSTATGTSGATIPLLNAANTWSGVQSFNSGDFTLKGSSSGSTTVNAAATASGTITFPAATDTVAVLAASQTLTNKTISGSSNTLSNIGNGSLTNSSTTIAGQTCTLGSTCGLSSLVASLGSDVALNNTSNFFDGPSVAQGSVGTWMAAGTVTVEDTAGAALFYAELWDGTTVIDSASTNTAAASGITTIALSGPITNPAANIRISVRDVTSTSGAIKFNVTGKSKDSTLSAWRTN